MGELVKWTVKNMLNDEYIKSRVIAIDHVRIGRKTTVCCITLLNGYEVIGISACVDAKNFDEKIGREQAYCDAERKIWELEGYLLQQQIKK
jgi:hypothetical protein